MIRLHADWKEILRKAWSIRLLLLAFVLSSVAGAIHVFDFIPAPDWVVIAVTILAPIVDGLAFVARLLAQANMERRK